LNESPIARLIREKESEAIDVDGDTLEFLAPDKNITSKMIVNRRSGEVQIETVLHYGARMIEQNIYFLSEILAGKFTEDQIHDIIEDISARLRLMELPELLQKPPEYKFKIVDQDEEGTKFTYAIPYDDPIYDDYNALRKEVDAILMASFELVYNYLLKMSLFIEVELNKFLVEETEMRLLEIRKILFRAQFYTEMTGRFANEQQRIAQSMKKEALVLISQFEKDYPAIAAEKLQQLRDFFKI
jgi:hypothetical protein